VEQPFKAGGCLTGLALTLLFAGCATMPDEPADSGLADTSWVLIATEDGAGSEPREVPLNKYAMSLDATGRARFTFDCNKGTSDWTAAPSSGSTGTLSFGPIAVTKALCPDTGFGEALAAALSKPRQYQIYDGRLTMSAGESELSYVWDSID